MNAKARFGLSGSASQYREQFIRLLEQSSHFAVRNRPTVNQKLKPVASFFKFLERIPPSFETNSESDRARQSSR